jgi:hypothetical protein
MEKNDWNLALTLRLSLTLRGHHCRLFERTGSHRIYQGWMKISS